MSTRDELIQTLLKKIEEMIGGHVAPLKVDYCHLCYTGFYVQLKDGSGFVVSVGQIKEPIK